MPRPAFMSLVPYFNLIHQLLYDDDVASSSLPTYGIDSPSKIMRFTSSRTRNQGLCHGTLEAFEDYLGSNQEQSGNP